jgi:hypothetical protein
MSMVVDLPAPFGREMKRVFPARHKSRHFSLPERCRSFSQIVDLKDFIQILAPFRNHCSKADQAIQHAVGQEAVLPR